MQKGKKKALRSGNLLTGYKIPKEKNKKIEEERKPNLFDYFMHPAKVTKYWWKSQTKYHAESAKHPLQYSDIIAITIFALIAAFITIWTRVMIWMRWSTFPDNSYFSSWHNITPWIVIFGSILYLVALYMKRVDFWLAYFPACVSIIYCLVELSMINAWMHPQDLASFFEALGLSNLPDWLIGNPP
jgi:hypothetical protein